MISKKVVKRQHLYFLKEIAETDVGALFAGRAVAGAVADSVRDVVFAPL